MKKQFVNPGIEITLFRQENISTTDGGEPVVNSSFVPQSNQESALTWVQEKAASNQKAVTIIQFN